MANFNTHLSVALAVSTPLAVVGLMFGYYGLFEMVLLSLVGMIGGLLPDIDLKHAKINQIGFTIASFMLAGFFLVMLLRYQSFSPLYALMIWGLLVAVFRFGIFGLFNKFAKHRGMVHSVPYMAMLSLVLVLVAHWIMEISISLSWLFGLFLFVGALVHLLLDEIYSVNIYNLKVKKSFGTAFKFYEQKKSKQYFVLYAILVGLWGIAPAKLELLKLFLPILK